MEPGGTGAAEPVPKRRVGDQADPDRDLLWQQRSGAACQRMGVTQSMGHSGSALDNAVIGVLALHPGVRAAVAASFRYPGAGPGRAAAAGIEDYNHNRGHSACQMLPPHRPTRRAEPGATVTTVTSPGQSKRRSQRDAVIDDPAAAGVFSSAHD